MRPSIARYLLQIPTNTDMFSPHIRTHASNAKKHSTSAPFLSFMARMNRIHLSCANVGKALQGPMCSSGMLRLINQSYRNSRAPIANHVPEGRVSKERTMSLSIIEGITISVSAPGKILCMAPHVSMPAFRLSTIPNARAFRSDN